MAETMEKELNNGQQECVNSKAEWLLIGGSAGTGKSLALCRRAKQLLEAGESVLFITGTTNMLDNYTHMLSNGKFARYEENDEQCVFMRKDRFYLKVYGAPVNYINGGKAFDEKTEEEITGFAADIIKRPDFERLKKDHVLIDEAQDFLIEELYLFAQLAKKSLTLVAGTSQEIFADDDTWEKKQARLEEICNKHFTKLELNIQLRMSSEILALANDIGSKMDSAVLPDDTAVSRGLPKLVLCNNEEEEIETLKKIVGGLKINERRVGVILGFNKGRRNLKEISRLLTDMGVEVYSNEIADTGLWVLNVANAKGIEFDDVILFLDNDNFFCDIYKKGSGAKNLYVAITRACSNLVMIADVNNRSGYIGNKYNKNTPVFDREHYKEERSV